MRLTWVKTEIEKKPLAYERCFDIISRDGIQVKFMDSYLSSEKDLVHRLYGQPHEILVLTALAHTVKPV